MLEAWSPELGGVVGVSGNDEPAGVYVFIRRMLDYVPRIGYFDLKEQFLPALAKDGVAVAPVWLGERMIRLRDRASYLAAVRRSLQGGDDPKRARRVSPRASVSGSAMLDGFCVVEDGAVIEDGAVVHDTVVLNGATVGGGAVVSRSIVGPLAAVAPRRRVVREIVFDAAARRRQSMRPRTTSQAQGRRADYS
jgi:NDP-sugar pyrophosphorylase family protein